MAFLEARGITKRYGPVVANMDVSFAAEKGELTALLGENGAGKTTLARIMSGDESADSGSVLLEGKKPMGAFARGGVSAIGLVHQHPLLAEDLSVSENICLGAEPLRGFLFLDRRRMLMRSVEASRDFGFSLNPDAIVRDLSPAERQEAEILRVLSRGAEAIILDEPTSLLAKDESDSLYRLLDRLAKAGKAVVVVTHRLSEVRSRADRFVFLRNGRNSGESDSFDEERAYEAMFGSGIGDMAKEEGKSEMDGSILGKRIILEAKGIGKECLEFKLASGEILAFIALAGNGLEDLEHLLSGARVSPEGRLFFMGRDIGRLSIGGRREAGFSYLASDRLRAGINTKATLAENLLALDGCSAFGFPGKSRRGLDALAGSKREVFSFEGDYGRLAGTLSGGQMQSVILNRELAERHACVLACQPSWGLDRVARRKAHQALVRARNAGSGILLLSSEIEEVIDTADRIIVLYRGRIVLESENSRGDGLEDRIARALIGEK